MMSLAARHSMLSTGARRGLLGSNLRRPFLSNNSSLFDRLISFWRLDEASGASRVDDFGSNNLTNNNTVTQVAGRVGNASGFVVASSQSLSVASNASLQTGDIDFTLTGWIYLTSISVAGTAVSRYNGSGAANFEYQIVFADTNRMIFQVSDTGDDNDRTTVTANTFGALSIDTWYFVAVWHDSTANTINISVNNGNADSTAHTGGVFVGTNTFRMGGNGAGTNYLGGRLDAWGFWKRLLTAAELTALYASGNGIELFPWGADRP